jgi:hypothetical protein
MPAPGHITLVRTGELQPPDDYNQHSQVPPGLFTCDTSEVVRMKVSFASMRAASNRMELRSPDAVSKFVFATMNLLNIKFIKSRERKVFRSERHRCINIVLLHNERSFIFTSVDNIAAGRELRLNNCPEILQRIGPTSAGICGVYTVASE